MRVQFEYGNYEVIADVVGEQVAWVSVVRRSPYGKLRGKQLYVFSDVKEILETETEATLRTLALYKATGEEQ